MYLQRDNKKHAPGFTLLEVMVAVSIAAVALVTIMELFALGLKTSKKSEDQNIAILYAKNLLGDSMAKTTLEEGVESGQFDDNYTWEREIIFYDMPKAGLPENIIEKELEPLVDTYHIKIQIYHAGRQGAVFELETLKTVFHEAIK